MQGFRYILAVLAIIIVVFIAIVLVIRRSPSTPATSQTGTAVKLGSIANTGVKVSYVVHGSVVGDDQYRSVRVTVDSNQRTIDVLEGYENKVVQTRTYSNNQEAFSTFLYALDNAGFTTKQTARFNTSKGACAQGNITDYSYSTSDGQPHLLWSSSCTRADGSFGGNISRVSSLFRSQITDYSKVTSNVKL
jgi:hypothetical protein